MAALFAFCTYAFIPPSVHPSKGRAFSSLPALVATSVEQVSSLSPWLTKPGMPHMKKLGEENQHEILMLSFPVPSLL